MDQSSLNFETLREANVRRCEQVFHKVDEWTPTDWATAMAGECGEACNEVKKLRRLDGADADQDTAESRHWLKVKIAHELADLIIYADLLAAASISTYPKRSNANSTKCRINVNLR